MTDDFIDDEYTDEEMNEMNFHLDAYLAILMTRSVSLSKKQRQKQNAGDDRKEFARKGVNYSQADSNLVPPGDALDKVKRDLKIDSQLEQLSEKVGVIKDVMKNTQIAAQIDEFSYSRRVYIIVQAKEKLGIQGMKAIADDMGILFKKQGQRKPKPPIQ